MVDFHWTISSSIEQQVIVDFLVNCCFEMSKIAKWFLRRKFLCVLFSMRR